MKRLSLYRKLDSVVRNDIGRLNREINDLQAIFSESENKDELSIRRDALLFERYERQMYLGRIREKINAYTRSDEYWSAEGYKDRRRRRGDSIPHPR